MAEKITVVRARAKRLLRKLEALAEFSREMNLSTQANEFVIRCSEIKEISKEFNETALQLLELEIAKAPNEEKIEALNQTYSENCEKFDDLYTEIRIKLDICEKSGAEKSIELSTPRRGASVKLPEIELKKFDGAHLKWSVFYENFKALIHENPGLSPVEKFHYLISSLSGSALSLVSNLPITAENYSIVWNNLISQYQDKRTLGGSLLETIFEQPHLSGNSAHALNKLVSVLHDSKEALKALNLSNLDDFILLHIALKKLPVHLRKVFEGQNVKKEVPSYQDLLDFSTQQAKIAELTGPFKHETYQNSRDDNVKKVYLGNERVKTLKACPYCDKEHSIYLCENFKKLSIDEKYDNLRKLKLCFNCFGRNHHVHECNSKFKCNICGNLHHTQLHKNSEYSSAPSTSNEPRKYVSNENRNIALTSRNISTSIAKNSTTLLGSAIIKIRDFNGQYHEIRAVVDSAAMSNFISESCAKRLRLPIRQGVSYICGLGDQKVKQKGVVECYLKPRNRPKPVLFSNAIVLPVITQELPSTFVHPDVRETWQNLELADPRFDEPGPVDLLIGAELFPYIYTGNRKLTEFHGCALESIFGWILTGRIPSTTHQPPKTTFLSVDGDILSLKSTLTRFWQIEEPNYKPPKSPDDELSEELFQKLHYRDESGRYVVPLLLKNREPVLSGSFHLAENRLISLERKLKRDPKRAEEYSNFMSEYRELGHMKEIQLTGNAAYYIPHHCVIREAALSTRLRVVFDASMSSANGISLNDTLLKGEKLQADIVQLILKFRTHKVAFTTDICKMFRQIMIRQEDRKYQHILWREKGEEPLKEFELCTVTYGTASAPFLAHRTIKQLVNDEKQNFPEASEILDKEVFTDDILTGAASVEKAIKLRNSLVQLLRKGGFELKKWSSSHPAVLEGLENGDMALSLDFNKEQPTSLGVLGLKWNPSSDQFSYNQVEFSTKATKRSILSNIARIFDPVGWITPIVLSAKILIQNLWLAGVGWDDPAPANISHSWLQILEQLPLLNNLKIPRLIFNPEVRSIILVGFCDGSEKGYGATVYLRVPTGTEFVSNLLIAKSKVAPIKPLTIPRLELCGALLLAKTLQAAQKSLELTDYKIERIITLTDSTTVLSWLTTPPYKLKTYVANRVTEIIETAPPENWRHVSSENNPADMASRGILPQQLVNNNFWWNGPKWLIQPEGNWQTSSIQQIQRNDPPELKSSKIALLAEAETPSFIERFSSLSKLIRVTAWCYRFYSNLKTSTRVSGVLSLDELESATRQLVKLVQRQPFSDALKALKNNKKVDPKLISLNPFLDTHGVLRVGGRLKHSLLTESAKHPIILPKSHHFTKLVISHFHESSLHAGPRLLQSIISQKYWIISARNAIKSQLHKCITCFRAAPRNEPPQMGNLPKSRVVPTRAFLRAGVDFGGPFLIKEGKRRNATSRKGYICLFICLATKALHLELVTELSTEAFVAALDRFISRRGMCEELFSDCGTNFVGANNQLSEITKYFDSSENEEEMQTKLAAKQIKWHFNPPSAPHFGGIWEAGIKAVKYHIKRVVGEQKLTYEEFTTVLTRIEAVLNSRPLCPVSADIEEIDALTPAHFLVGGPLLSLPEYNWDSEPTNRLSRWQLLQQISQQFWRRWSQEYLNTLQQRQKWKTNAESLAVGDLVLIKDDNAAPLVWPMGRVIELHPGSDFITRVVTVRTATGSLKRPVIKLFKLPIA